MLTVPQVVARVAKAKGSYSDSAFYRHKVLLGIVPVGARKLPQLYPDETPWKILAHLGFDVSTPLPDMAHLRGLKRGGRK